MNRRGFLAGVTKALVAAIAARALPAQAISRDGCHVASEPSKYGTGPEHVSMASTGTQQEFCAEATVYLEEISASTGEDMAFLTESLVKGIGRDGLARPLALDNLYLTVNVPQAYQEHARALNKPTDRLSQIEKQQAVMNYVLVNLRRNSQERWRYG